MGVLLRNWHLKLGAVALATVLYTGLVFSGSFSDATRQVPVQVTGQPEGVFVLTQPVATVNVSYRVSNETAQTVSDRSFVATVDLSEYDMDRAPEPQVLPVRVEALADGLQVGTVDPATVTVALDRVEVRSIPVVVEYEPVPEGLEVDEPVVDVDDVEARGPASLLERVDHAVARVLIDASGIDVERDVTLEPVDFDGQPVESVDLSPGTVSVQIDVRTLETNRTVPVRPQVEGTPAAGFALESLSVDPSTVTLRGLPDVLADVEQVLTEPLSIADASEDQTFTAALVLPDGVRLSDAAAEPSVNVTATIAPSVSSRSFVVGVVCADAGTNACLPSLDQITVTLGGPADQLASLDAADVTGILDVGGLAAGQHTVDVALPALPDGVDLIGITPSTVTVTIVPPATPTPTPAP